MEKRFLYVLSNQHGSVINVALLILILIFLIGIGLSKMSTTDIKIANNIKQDMETFYETDASLEGAGELIEQNLACGTGFESTVIGGKFYVNTPNFWQNERKKGEIPGLDPTAVDGGGDPRVDFFYPPDLAMDWTKEPHSNISLGGASRYSKGSAIQQHAGYEGLGKGAAAGGASIIFDVYSQRLGQNNTSSTHFMQWVHLIKPSGGCFF